VNPCDAQVAVDCAGRAVHVHHRKRRSQGGTNDPHNLLKVCVPCHGWIHAHPASAVMKGLLVNSWQNPEEVPVTVEKPGLDELCPTCKKPLAKRKKSEPARKRVTLGIRLPKDADEDGIEVLETLLSAVRDDLRPEMGWTDTVPVYYVICALAVHWLQSRGKATEG